MEIAYHQEKQGILLQIKLAIATHRTSKKKKKQKKKSS